MSPRVQLRQEWHDPYDSFVSNSSSFDLFVKQVQRKPHRPQPLRQPASRPAAAFEKTISLGTAGWIKSVSDHRVRTWASSHALPFVDSYLEKLLSISNDMKITGRDIICSFVSRGVRGDVARKLEPVSNTIAFSLTRARRAKTSLGKVKSCSLLPSMFIILERRIHCDPRTAPRRPECEGLKRPVRTPLAPKTTFQPGTR